MNKILNDFSKFLSLAQATDLSEGKTHMYQIGVKKYIVIDGKKTKIALGENYKYIFNKTNGDFMRWGETYKDDPEYSPIGGEILDIEVTTICNGINGKLCSFCYKSNTPSGKNMSFDTFKDILNVMGVQLTQVAFGADSQATSNPDLFKMADSLDYRLGYGIKAD